jgi:hypothetical protein
LPRLKKLTVKLIEALTKQVSQRVVDLLALVTGLFYFRDFIQITNPRGAEDDRETQLFLWRKLKEDILREHIKHRPGSRPWAFLKLEDREERRVVEIDQRMLANEGKILESETEYLERLGLLRKKEREALRE